MIVSSQQHQQHLFNVYKLSPFWIYEPLLCWLWGRNVQCKATWVPIRYSYQLYLVSGIFPSVYLLDFPKYETEPYFQNYPIRRKYFPDCQEHLPEFFLNFQHHPLCGVCVCLCVRACAFVSMYVFRHNCC